MLLINMTSNHDENESSDENEIDDEIDMDENTAVQEFKNKSNKNSYSSLRDELVIETDFIE